MLVLLFLLNTIYDYSNNIVYKELIPIYNNIINEKGNIEKQKEILLYKLTYLDTHKLLPSIIKKINIPSNYRKELLLLNGYNCPYYNSFTNLSESMTELKKFTKNDLYKFINYMYKNRINFYFSPKHKLYKKTSCLFNYFNNYEVLIEPIDIKYEIKKIKNFIELKNFKNKLQMQQKFNSIIGESDKVYKINKKLIALELFFEAINKNKNFKDYNNTTKLKKHIVFMKSKKSFFTKTKIMKASLFLYFNIFLETKNFNTLKLLEKKFKKMNLEFKFISQNNENYSYSELKELAFYRLLDNLFNPPYNNCGYYEYINLFKNKDKEFIKYSLLKIIKEGYGVELKYSNCNFRDKPYKYLKEIYKIYLENQ